MSDDLSALIRAAAFDQESAARAEAPYSTEMFRRYVRDVRRRRAAGGATLAAVGAVVVGGVLVGAAYLAPPDHLAPVGTPSAPSVTPSTTGEATPSPTPTPAPTTAPAPTTVAPTAPTTPPPTSSAAPPTHEATSAPPAAPLVAVPGAVTVLSSGPGGGSGEVMVLWASTPGATGYHVYRSDVATGPFALSASFDAATGLTTVAYLGSYESIQIWQPASGELQYVEAIHGAVGYFRVSAVNAAGEGPLSGVVCGEPQTGALPTGC